MSASPDTKAANQMWGGRFAEGPDAIMTAINASIGFDHRLYRQDIAGSIAHARMLAQSGILTEADRDQIVRGLNDVLAEIEGNRFTFSRSLEDIHMNVESRLKELIGDAAGRLHTARSRNDQVATDIRLWLRGTIDDIHTTITHGIRNTTDPDARYSEMPKFGVDGILEPAQIDAVVEHVLAISGQEHDAALVAGKGVFERQIARLHFLDDGLELRDRRFERLGRGCRLGHG